MNRVNGSYHIHNYYDTNTISNVNNTQQESNLQANRFAPLFNNEQNYEHFKQDIDCDYLISNLYGELHLSEDEYYLLDNETIRYKKITLLVDILNNKLLDATEEDGLNFVESISNLIKIQQPFLAPMLNKDTINFLAAKKLAEDTPINSRTIINAIENMTVETIEPLFITQDNYEAFKRDIDIDPLISSLYCKDIISQEEYDDLSQNIARPQKTNILINILNAKLNTLPENKDQLIEELKNSLTNIGQFFLLHSIG